MSSPTTAACDLAALEVQLGRPTQGESRVARRCHLRLPVVAQVAPVTDDGRPFPTLYWLSCPLLVRRVARIEERGAVRGLDQRRLEDEEFARALEEAHESYSRARGERVPDGAERVPTGGIGGSRGGVKCLHAHLAEYLVLGRSPVGSLVYDEVMPLDCSAPCVELEGERPRKNPAWREPR